MAPKSKQPKPSKLGDDEFLFGLTEREARELEVWREYHDATEKDMRDGGPLAGCRDFAGKLAGHAARLAGILAMIESGGDSIGREIPGDAVRRACVMMRDYFQPHGLAAYEMMFETGDNSLASRVVAWLNRHEASLFKSPVFSQADLYRDLRGGADVIDSSELEGPLASLVDRGYLRQVEPEGKTGTHSFRHSSFRARHPGKARWCQAAGFSLQRWTTPNFTAPLQARPLSFAATTTASPRPPWACSRSHRSITNGREPLSASSRIAMPTSGPCTQSGGSGKLDALLMTRDQGRG